VLIYVAPVRLDGRTVGVCYLEYDWEGQAAAILHNVGQTGNGAVVTIVDEQNRMVASTGHYAFNALLPIASPAIANGRHIEARDESIIAQAMATPFNGFDGLKLRCVIEQHVPNEREIAHALASPRARAA